jgi:hypothetical protein
MPRRKQGPPGKRPARDRLFGRRWVHVFEEDTSAGAVYRAEDESIPLSRRPREYLELERGGKARLFMPGPDDRPMERPGTWHEEGGALVIRPQGGGTELRIVDRSEARLVVQAARRS